MFWSSEGSQLFYMTLGAGPNLVLLHPTPLDHRFWMPIATNLMSRYRITLPDLRGHGQSEAGGGIISTHRLSRDVERLLDASGIEHAVFVGCSIGSYVLYELWRQIPQRIDALGFCCGKPQPDSAANRTKRRETIEKVRQDGTEGFFDQMIHSLVTPAFRQQQPDKVAELRAMMDPMAPEAVIAVQEGLMERPDSVPTVKTISVATLVLAAAEDQAASPEEMKVIPDLLPGAKYYLLPATGHFAAYEQPEAVGGILGRFLDSLSL